MARRQSRRNLIGASTVQEVWPSSMMFSAARSCQCRSPERSHHCSASPLVETVDRRHAGRMHDCLGEGAAASSERKAHAHFVHVAELFSNGCTTGAAATSAVRRARVCVRARSSRSCMRAAEAAASASLSGVRSTGMGSGGARAAADQL
eukprot:scaffold229946_cov28-Tisochrysis_lutea.AAC.5